MDLIALTLNQWISYIEFIEPYEKQITEYSSLKDCQRKKILIVNAIVERACQTYEYFEGNMIDVDTMIEYYNSINGLFTKKYESSITVPADVLDVYTPITFGQFVDSKMICDKFQGNKWGLFKYLIAIYTNGIYEDKFCNEKGEQFILAGQLKMSDIVVFSQWWERFNTNINETFAVFKKSVNDGKSPNMDAFMKDNGWIDFQLQMAKLGIFTIPNGSKNPIECVRLTNLYEVLLIAGNEKMKSEASYNDLNDR